MRLSIITINYNDAQGLRKTFESIKNQTCKDFEYVVVDGNSSDGSKDVILEYEQYISKWVSEPDTGIYNAMNKGARMSSGQYMLFLNSGDYLYSKDVVQKLIQIKSNDDIICCSVEILDPKGSLIKFPPANVSLYTFIGGGSMLHPATLIGRHIFNEVGGYIESYRIISDWCFFVDAMVVRACSYYVEKGIIVASFNTNGISSTDHGEKRSKAQQEFLESRFKRILCDYNPLADECVSNVSLWLSNSKPSILKTIIRFEMRVINSILKLRSKLDRRTNIILPSK